LELKSIDVILGMD
jgi:hypothetical protein